MRRGFFKRSKCSVGLLLLPLASCATVDHKPELAAANQAMSRATGVKARWAALPEIRELVIDESGRVPLGSIVDLTLSNNRSLRADLEVLGQTKADLVQAGLLSNPVLSILGGLPAGGGRARVSFGLSKELADLWLIPVRKRAALALVQQRVLSFTDTAIALLTEAKATYYGLQYQVQAIELQDQNLGILQKSMEIAQERQRAGDTTQLDVNLVRARYLEAQNALLQLRSDANISRRLLLRIMSVSKGAVDWNPDPFPAPAKFPAVSAEEADLVEIALLQRLDVQAARWQLESAIADFQQQRRRVIPSLNLGISAERLERRGLPDRDILADTARASLGAGKLTAPEIQSAAERRKERRQEIDFVLGPSIEVPLPIFDQNQAQIAKAQFRARELQQRYEEIEQRVAEGVRNAFVQRRLAEDRVKLFRDSLVPLQEANLALARTAYQSGRESILTVLLAQESLIRTRLDFAAAVRDLEVSMANLERHLSGPIPDVAPVAPAGP